MATAAEDFRANLHELATARRFDQSALATKCDFRGDDRKWLDRVWTNGLQRPDPRTESKLKKLVDVLGLDDPAVLWHGDFVPSPYALISDSSEWEKLVGDILWKHQLYEHANPPASLVPLPKQAVPSRGWGEDFWVRVTERSAS